MNKKKAFKFWSSIIEADMESDIQFPNLTRDFFLNNSKSPFGHVFRQNID